MEAKHILILIGYALLFYGIPTLMAILIYRFIKKKNYHPKWRLIALIPVLVILYGTFAGLYWPNSFYKKHFEEATGLVFPESGEILVTEKWENGAYVHEKSTAFLANVDKQFFSELPRTLKDRGFSEGQTTKTIPNHEYYVGKLLGTTHDIWVTQTYHLSQVESVSLDYHVFYQIEFLSDSTSLIVFTWHD